MRSPFRRRSGRFQSIAPPLLACAIVAGLAACTAREPAAEPTSGVLLVTIDTLRPDALGWVAGENATPAIDALAARAFRFPHGVAPAPLTGPSHASILSGLTPRRHGLRDNGQVLPEGVASLASILADRGWATAAIVSGSPLRKLFGLDRGFAHYDDQLPLDPRGRWRDRPAAETSARAASWLEAQLAGDTARPWLLWVHYYDPHDPYEPPPGLARSGPRGAYDGEVAAVDAALGALLAKLRALDRERATLVVLAGDHGESLGEHGEETHGFFVYDATVLVPILIASPGEVRPGESAAPARLVDLAPTVLDLLGMPAPDGLDGVSLRPTLEGREQEIPPAYLEALQPWLGYGWAPLAAVRTREAKLIRAPRSELYDLASDPAESIDLFARDRVRAGRLAALLAEAERRPAVMGAATDDPGVLAELRALGYVATARPADLLPPAGLADPKDRLQRKNLLARAEDALAQGETLEGAAVFSLVLDEEPGNRYALLRFGQTLLAAGKAPAAIAPLEQLVRLDPEHPEARYALAEARMQAGRWSEAAAEWMEVVRRQPRRAVAWSNLGLALFQAGERQRALSALERAAALAPDDRGISENLALVRAKRTPAP